LRAARFLPLVGNLFCRQLAIARFIAIPHFCRVSSLVLIRISVRVPTGMPSYDPLIPSTVTATMRAILEAVSRGSVLYTTGTVSATKALALAAKFDERYDLGMNSVRRDHARRAGRSVFRLVMFPLQGTTDLAWWLLRSEGDHPLAALEKWKDARRESIRWPWRYELVRLPVPVAHRRKMQGIKKRQVQPVGWTWRIRIEEVRATEQTVRHVAQHRDDRLAQIVSGLRSAPGFRGIRQDVAALYRYIREQCRRRNREPPPMPTTIRWVGAFRKHQTWPLSVLVRRVQRGRASWFPAYRASGQGGGDILASASSHQFEDQKP